jgi:hypothetical protein
MNQDAKLQEPIPLEDLLQQLGNKAANSAQKMLAAAILSSVAHLASVKDQLAELPDVTEAVAQLVVNPMAYAIRYELLMIVGELCRREHKDDAQDGGAVSRANARSKKFCAHFGALAFLPGILKEIAGDEDSDCAAVAADLLSALPSADGTWGKAQRDAAKDLMFLDDRHKAIEFAPLVVRASRRQCAGCGAAAAADGAGFNRCAACKAVFYCTAECQKAHWKAAHKAPCTAARAGIKAGFRQADGSPEAFTLLYLENRSFIYQLRSEVLHDATFEEYFMRFAEN